jgi:hypothetical protein
MPQIQGVQGRSRSKLLRALGNAEDGVSSAFPQGKQNGVLFDNLYFYLTHKEFWQWQMQTHPAAGQFQLALAQILQQVFGPVET